ncbi:putative serine/threonine-protein phosphatase [Aspergillus foveolatus]|uniref:putative serine/threonine-protein phosphatase n=1 Tax=Aspergillus foveolatus TaxID=210207 RepID=UPI003CCD1632
MADRERSRSREALDISDDISEDGLYHPHPSSSPPTRLSRFARPLIDYVRNEWQSNSVAKYSHLGSASSNSVSDRTDAPRWVQIVLSIVAAPRFRRYVLVYLALLGACILGWQFFLFPRLKENSAILTALDPKEKAKAGGWFGANAVPQLEDMIQLKTLDPALLPAREAKEDDMEKLLDKVSFQEDRDHLIFTGDLVEKGPDSLGVVDLARQYNASCVRGNHEDRVLVLRHDMLESNITDDSWDIAHPESAKSRELARQLSAEQADWLDACPVVLNVGQITNMGQVVVVHAGLIPGVNLDRQDPYSVMNMKTVDLPTHVPSSSLEKGVKWTKLFNKHQTLSLESKNGVMTVIYGHDSKSGLSIKEYTKGLDSGCVKGGKLTAMVISDGGKQEIVQVKCSSNYVKDEEKEKDDKKRKTKGK